MQYCEHVFQKKLKKTDTYATVKCTVNSFLYHGPIYIYFHSILASDFFFVRQLTFFIVHIALLLKTLPHYLSFDDHASKHFVTLRRGKPISFSQRSLETYQVEYQVGKCSNGVPFSFSIPRETHPLNESQIFLKFF